MSRVVNPSLYRIGKNIYWNVLYSSNYKSTGMRFHLILNLTLLSIFRLLNFRVIKIFINVENYKLKLFVAGFRLTKLYRLATDLNDINLFSKFNKAFLRPPMYFGGSHNEFSTMAGKGFHFDAFMKNTGALENGTKILDSFSYISEFEHNFTKNLSFISKWAVCDLRRDYNNRMAPLIRFAVKVRSVLKLIESREMALILLKNPKAYYFLIFKNFFILAAAGIKTLRRFRLKKWYLIFKKAIKPLLRRLVKNNVLAFKNNSGFSTFSVFSRFCMASLKNRSPTYPLFSNILKKKSSEHLVGLYSSLKILKLIIFLRNLKKKTSTVLKLSVLSLTKIIIRNVVDDYMWFPKKAAPARNLKLSFIPANAKINDFAAQSALVSKKKKKGYWGFFQKVKNFFLLGLAVL